MEKIKTLDVKRIELPGKKWEHVRDHPNMPGTPWIDLVITNVDLSFAPAADLIVKGVDLRNVHISNLHSHGVDLRHVTVDQLKTAGVLTNDRMLEISEDLLGWVKRARVDVPIVPDMHRQLALAIGKEGEYLPVDSEHESCHVLRNRAEWVVHLAGREGAALEDELRDARACDPLFIGSDSNREPVELAADLIHKTSYPSTTCLPAWKAPRAIARLQIQGLAWQVQRQINIISR